MDEQRAWIRSRRKRRLRLTAAILAFCLLFTTYPDILEAVSVFAAGSRGDGGPMSITGFVKLPEETAEQTVPMGTDRFELDLPETLEAYVTVEAEDDTEDDRKLDDGDQNKDDDENDGDSDQDKSDKENPDEDDNDNGDDKENTDEDDDNGGDDNDGAENPGDGNGNGTDDNSSDDNGDETYGVDNDADSEEEPSEENGDVASGLGVRTGSFVMPVYMSENQQDALPVETLTDSANTTETITIENITWQSNPKYDKDTEGIYLFTPVLPEDYAPADGVSLPEITVTVQDEEDGGEIELLMRPYDEETSSDIVYYLEDSYESYSWEIWAGEEWEETGESEPELVVSKEEWYTYRFRCIVIKDGVRYTARALDDWQIDNFGIMTMAVNSADSGRSDYMYYSNSGEYFNVKGIDNNTFIQTSYKDEGYRTASVTAGGGKVSWYSPQEVAMGNSLYGTRDISLVYNGRYVKITYTVENRGSASQSFSVGSSADVMIGNNDFAPVVGSANGLVMSGRPKNSYTFNLVAPTVNTLWYGFFWEAYENIFNNRADRSTPYDGDSGLAWSWSDTLAPGQTWSRYVLLGVGELPEPPRIPTLTNQDPQLQPGKPTVFTGTAEPGDTVSIEVGGEEFSGTADDSGNFSVTVTPPQDLPEGETKVNYYAVSEEGGISDVGTITATVVKDPSIELTDAAVSVVEDSVLDDTWYRGFISSSSGTVSYNASAVRTGTPGVYTVTYTARKAGFADATATLTVTVLPLPLELSAVTATRVSGKDSFTLSASLLHTGGGTISETGFVWGIMQNPTVSMNNGSKKTDSIIKTKGANLTVTAEQIVDGVTYYARAYVKTSDGNVYYSLQKSFSIGGKSYGTFTIKNNGNNTFTVTRTGGTDGAQMIYFRTVNGSAVGGTHFTHQASTLTFAAGESSKTITISENAVTKTYNSKAATAYSNANRTYQVEIYRVDGGGVLGSTTSAVRTMAKDSSYTVDRNIYTNYVENTNPAWSGKVTDDTCFGSNPSMSLIMTPSSATAAYGDASIYITNTAYAQAFYILMDIREEDDGYQHIRFSTDNGYVDQWQFEIKPPGVGDSWRNNAHFPCDTVTPSGWNSNDGATNFVHQTSSPDMPYVSGEQYLSVPISAQIMTITFDAHGDSDDDWRYANTRMYRRPLDNKEPQLLGVAPMAGGTYKVGDKVTVSLIFDEIVDNTNSTLSNVSLNTSWGTFAYAGGADTNVLYFTGTVPSGAAGTLTVNSITGAGYIKDMCSTSGTAASGSGSVSVSVDNKTPTVNITNSSIENKTAKATITATNADKLQYTWSQNSAMPVTGWLTGTKGQTVNTKQTSGTWYLHVLGTYNATGAIAHTYASFNFSSSSSGSLPELTLSVDNSTWAQSRKITLTKTPSTAAVTVKTPSGTTSAVSGTSYTAAENGSYTFTLTSGGETVVKSITVSKIDRTAPTAAISGPASLAQNENVILTIVPADAGGAGVKTVAGIWEMTVNGGTAQTVTATLTKNSDGTYSAATPGTEGNSYTCKLTVTMTDNAGNTGSAGSGTYTVNLKAPTIDVNLENSSNKGDTYSYTVNANGNTITAVQLPDGTITTVLSGTFTLTSPGTYYATVSDEAGHVVRSNAMTIAAEVDGDAPMVRLYQQNTDWTNEVVQIDVSIYEEKNIASAVWEKEGADSDKAVTYSKEETSVYGGTFTVTDNGTYTVTVTDDSGNVGTASITVSNIDIIAPVIGELSYNYEPKKLWNWLIGKESLIITVPVTEEGSGAEITYTMTPEGGLLENKTAEIENGSVTITVSADFKGTIVINCTDKAKNSAPSVTVGTSGKGLIIEDNAPEITFGEFSADSGISVTVKDDQENAVSAGLASVTYKIGNGEEVSVQENFTESLKSGVSFTIKSDQIPLGEVEISVKATDNAGNQTEQAVMITKLAAPDLARMDFIIDYRKETGKLPEDLGELEVYTDPSDPEGSVIPPNEDGSRPIVPGQPIYVRYPEKTTEDGKTIPPSGSVKIDIPDRPVLSAKKVTVTDTTAKVTDPAAGEEYVLVKKGQTPDWSSANTTGAFTGLDPNTEYDLYARKKATDTSFVSDPVKTEVRTLVTIKEPVITGDGKGMDGNTASGPDVPYAEAGGTVIFTGTYEEDYTPVIIVGGQEMNPGAEITWNEGSGKGGWEYTLDIPEDAKEAGITVEFRKRTIIGVAVTPGTLTIYADHAANESIDALTAYLKENSSVQVVYDNETKDAAQAAYTTADSFTVKGGTYSYTVTAGGKTGGITLKVASVNAAITAPAELMKIQRADGYTVEEVAAWLPAQVKVTYTGDGYTARTENRTVTWRMDAIGADFGKTLGRKTISGTVALPAWATGRNTVSIGIEFVDRNVLKDSQMKLSISGWIYGAKEAPDPKGSITVKDTNPVYTYLYSADSGNTWVTAEELQKSSSGHLVPGTYGVKMTYKGDNYAGVKTAYFIVSEKPLTVEKGTLEAENRDYDGTTDAALKEGGEAEISGVVERDETMLGGTLSAVFTKKGPGKNIPVNVTGFELEGRDAGCYELKNTTLKLYATINNADGTPPSGGSGGNGGGGNDDGSDNGGSTPGDDSDPGIPTVTPPRVTPPSDKPQPVPGTEDTPDKETQPEPQPEGTPKQDDEPESTETEAPEQEGDPAQPDNKPQPEDETVQTVQVSVEGGRIVVSGGMIKTGNITETSDTTSKLSVGDGAVIVTVVCEDEGYAAGVNDTVAVANAVLTPEQIQLVNDGETIEVRIDVKDISGTVGGQDKEVIEKGLAAYQNEIQELALGMYVDISMFIRLGEGEWDAVTSTKEPIEVIIGVPEELQEDGREFYIIRSHEGEYTLLNDMDNDPDTVTISTNLFSAYAIAFKQTDTDNAHGGNAKCGLCHICPTFLGFCCFIWLAVIAAVCIVVVILILKRKKETEKA